MTRRFEGKVALVTGAASGIGRATARLLAREGARVTVSDVDGGAGARVVAEIEADGGAATFLPADVADPVAVATLVSGTLERYGQLDCAVNNAGIEGALAATAEYPIETWRRTIDVNLTGTWLSMRAEIPAMLDRGGTIVNMASILGVVGLANAGAYVASKHGVIGMTRAAALEYAGRGIRINAICPGFIETPMVMDRGLAAGTHPEVRAELEALHPIGRLGRPEEIAEAIAWLASSESSFVSGHALLADGGYVAR